MSESEENIELNPTSSDWALEEGEIIVFSDAETENSVPKGEAEKESSVPKNVGRQSPAYEKRSASKANDDPRSTKKAKDQSYDNEKSKYKERDEKDSAFDRKQMAQKKRSESKGRKYNMTRGRPYHHEATRRSYRSPSPPRYRKSYRSPSRERRSYRSPSRERRSYRTPSPRARRSHRTPSPRRHYRNPSPRNYYSPSPKRYRTPSPQHHQEERYSSGACGNSSDMVKSRSYSRYRGDYSQNTGEKHSSPRKDKPGNLKIVTKPVVKKIHFPEDYLSKIDFNKEKHIFVVDSPINKEAKQTAGKIEIRDYPNHTIEEMTEEVINIINNNDDNFTLYITAAIFDREFERLEQSGIENLVNDISSHIKANCKMKEQVHLNYATLPYHPDREHIWPELEIANNFLKEETVALESPVFNLHSWLQKPGKTMKDKQCKGTFYAEFVGKRGLGLHLNQEGQDKVINGYIRHCSRASTATLGDMSERGRPVPLAETGGYRLYPSTPDNKWLSSHMGYMTGLIINQDKIRQTKIQNLQLTAKNNTARTDESDVQAGAKQTVYKGTDNQVTDKPQSQLTTAELDGDDPQDSSTDEDDVDSNIDSEEELKKKQTLESLKSVLKFKIMEVKLVRGINKTQEEQIIEAEKSLKEFTKDQKLSEKKTFDALKNYEDQYDRDQTRIQDLISQQANQVKEAEYLRTRLNNKTEQWETLNKEKQALEQDLLIQQDLVDTLKKSLLNMSKKLDKQKQGKYDE